MNHKTFFTTILILLFALQANAQTIIDGIEYNLNEPKTGEATVTSRKNGEYSGEVFIPSTVTDANGNTYTVTAIGDNAFKQCRNLTSVSIPYTVESLGDKAFFQCSGIITIRCDALIPPAVPDKSAFHKMEAERVTMIVPGQSIHLYAEADYWKEFIYNPADDSETGGTNSGTDNGGTVIVTKTNYEILDNLETFLEKPITFSNQTSDPSYNEYNIVSYRRNFKNTDWQALYVPIELVYSDWSDKFEVAKINSILEYNTHFYAMADIVADEVKPHTLYLIRAKAIGEYSITVSRSSRTDTDGDPLHKVYTSNLAQDATAPNIVTEEELSSSSGATYTFTGQYAKGSLKEADHTRPPYRYAMTGGELKRPNPANTAGIPLGAFRWWLEVTPATGGQGLMFSTGKIGSDSAGETSAGSIKIDLSKIEGIDIYYDLNGRRVDNPSKGIYIQNGRKVYIK